MPVKKKMAGICRSRKLAWSEPPPIIPFSFAWTATPVFLETSATSVEKAGELFVPRIPMGASGFARPIMSRLTIAAMRSLGSLSASSQARLPRRPISSPEKHKK
jgi:hypothetical protein